MAGQIRGGRFEVAVVGVTFEGRQETLSRMYGMQEQGSQLTGRLRREPFNRFDPNAIVVEVENAQIGYIPKALAARLTRHMDAGEIIEVTEVRIIKNSNPGKEGFGARIDVEMQAQKEAV